MNKLFLISFCFVFTSVIANDEKLDKATEHALAWLEGQLTPNKHIPKPFPTRSGMILSYLPSPDDPSYKYIYSKSTLYDNALAIIAFNMAGRFSQSRKIIDSFEKSISKTGKLWFNFNTHDSWPNDKDEGDAIVRNGASAWFGYALVHYLKMQVVEREEYKESEEWSRYSSLLKKVIDRIVRDQVLDKMDKRYGLLTGGEGSYVIEKSKKDGVIREVFNTGNIEWNSIEHNIDSYFFIRDTAVLLGDKKLEKSSELLSSSLLDKSWNGSIGQFNRGHNKNGFDPLEALDTASWGAMFLISVGEYEKAEKALKKAESYLNTDKGITGHKPYLNMLVYEEKKINALMYPQEPTKNWNDVDIVWLEGTYGVVMALIKMERRALAKKIMLDLLKVQNKDGSLPYSTQKIEFQFTDAPSVASTAWFVMCAKAFQKVKLKHSFWGKTY